MQAKGARGECLKSPMRSSNLAFSVYRTAFANSPPGKHFGGHCAIVRDQRGRELLHRGWPADLVVHGYGDLCQAITELASEFGKPVQIHEFRTLNRCLDNAIADAVTEYRCGESVIIAEQGIGAPATRPSSPKKCKPSSTP